jgi:hypothetical protein
MIPAVIFVNGPSRCGKDTFGKHIEEILPGFQYKQASKILKEQTNALYGRSDLPWDFWEDNKDEPSPTFLGFKPREAWIKVSETYMKPTHGQEIYGKLLLKEMQASPKRAYVVDCGYSLEASPIIRAYGADNCKLVRIHAEGRGCSFKGDSRSHIVLPSVESFDIQNNGNKARFIWAIDRQFGRMLQQMVGGT